MTISADPRFVVAVAQLTSRQSVRENLATCRALAEEAKGRGAHLVTFPENAPFLGREADRLSVAEPVEGSVVEAFRSMARELELAVLVGSVAETGPDPGHSYNTSLLIAPSGAIVATYRKIHLFDVEVEGAPPFLESSTVAAGSELVVADFMGAKVGFSVCYDLRFAELYRSLRNRGAEVMFVPAAFTERTGRDHWEVLLRARAIENQCYVVAPNQTGLHLKGRVSYGRSMIIDPWGIVIAQAGDGEGIAVAEIDLARVRAVRAKMPCFDHVRLP
jgi:predicted amidohydrolase